MRKGPILVVEDVPNVLELLELTLRFKGYDVVGARDGLEGLDLVEKNSPALIITDILMPRLDGFGVVESLRADPRTRELPIIVISEKELTAAETSRLKETVALVMKKQGFEGEKLLQEIMREPDIAVQAVPDSSEPCTHRS